MSGQERFVAFAEALEGFQFAGAIDRAVRIVADVEGDDAYRVAGDEEFVLLLVIEDKGEDAVQFLQEVDALVAVEGEDDLAVASGLEGIGALVAFADAAVIVYLAVHGQHLSPVGRIEGLPAALGIDDGEAFVGQDGRASAVDAAPVGAAVAYFLGHGQGLGA